MFLSVYLSSNSMCAAKGSFLTTFSSGLRFQEWYSPDRSRRETLKSSGCTNTPEPDAPDGGVIVKVTGLDGVAPRPRPPMPPTRGKRKRCCKVAGLYFFPIPPRSPVGEWQV